MKAHILAVAIIAVMASTIVAGRESSASSPDKNDRHNRLRESRENDRRRTDRREPETFEAVDNFPNAFRTVNGTENNPRNADWGAVDSAFLRLADADYADGLDEPTGADRASARVISNALCAQDADEPNYLGASAFIWQWGQFLDHDITLTPTIDPAEDFPIAVPLGDVWFDPYNTGTQIIPMERSFYVHDSAGVRQQINEITAWIDASNVYGSDDERAADLRANDGTGRLRMSDDAYLPYNENGLDNAPTNEAHYYIAGDFRANEQIGLTAMHTLFAREHNHWADHFREKHPDYTGDQIYELARGVVAAEMQAITYREFLPKLLGPRGLKRYRGYRPEVEAGISNEFATAAYRFGHSTLNDVVLRLDADGNEIPEGNLSLAQAFFNPALLAETGIEPILRGLAAQTAQEVDTHVVDSLRNFLFGPPGSGGLDLASLNIQRGRDHGLASYNDTRRALGMRPANSFVDINSDPVVASSLASVYDSVEDVDLWVGGLSEPHVPEGLLGPTFARIVADQFERLRDGDRFWYKRYLPPRWVRMVERQTLAQIIMRNTDIAWELQNDVFLVAEE